MLRPRRSNPVKRGRRLNGKKRGPGEAKLLKENYRENIRNYQDYLLIERRMSPKSVESYTHDTRAFLLWAQRRKITDLRSLGRDEVVAHITHLRKEGRADTGFFPAIFSGKN